VGVHLVIGQREVEDLGVGLDALPVRGLRQNDRAALQTPADQDLRRGPLGLLGDPCDRRIGEMAEAGLGFSRRIAAPGVELRRDEDLIPGDAAIAQRSSDARLVAIGLRRVDVAIAGLERPTDGVLTLRPVGHLPDPESEGGDDGAVCQNSPLLVAGHVASARRCVRSLRR
jgi:hypothetical protein